MLADRLARACAARGIHYAWVMAALGFFYSLFSTAALGVPGVLILPLSEELGLSIGEVSAPQGLRFALFGLVAPFAGGLMLRYGPRRMLTAAALLLLAGLALTVTMTERWQVWLALGVILGVAPGMTALQLSTIIASRWFVARRGLVVGVLNGAVATGALLFLPLAAWISEQWGWRAALLPPALGVAVMLALYRLLGKERPQDLNLPAYGEAVAQPVPPPPSGNFLALSFRALGMGLRSGVFWVLAFTFFICGVSSYGITQTHLVPFCSDLGVPLVTSAMLLAVIGVCDLIGTIASGWLSDRYDNRWLLAWYYGFRGVSLIWLVYSDVTLAGLAIFAVLYGLDFIATVPPTVRLTTRAFGAEMGPALVGWIFAAHQLGVGVMAWAAGVSHDALESYVPAFLVAGLLCLVAALSFTLLRRPAPPPAVAMARA